MAVSASINLSALPQIYPSVEAAPNGTFIQCRLRKEDVPIVGLRSEVYNHSHSRNFVGVITIDGPKKGLFIPQGQFYGFGAFDVSNLLSINVQLNPRANVSQQQIGFLYLDPHSNAVWMWSELDDMVSWICIIPAVGLARGQLERGLALHELIELGEPVLCPLEKQTS